MNNKGIPPVNTKDNCKTLGCNVPKVEIMGLESTIRQMKKRSSRYGDMSIAEDINNTILKDSKEKIASMDIWRWWKKHKDDEDPTEDRINIYGSHLSSIASITRQLERLEFYLDNLDSQVTNVDEIVKVAKETNGLMATYDKLSMRKSALLGLVGEIQAKVYTYQNFGIVLDTVMAEVESRDPRLHFDIVEKLKKDPLLAEVIRRIKEETK